VLNTLVHSTLSTKLVRFVYLILVSFNFLGSRYLRVPSGVLCTLHVHVDTRILLRLVLNITIILCCIFCHYFIRVYDMYHVCMRLVCCLWYVCVTHTSNFLFRIFQCYFIHCFFIQKSRYSSTAS